MNPRIFVNQEIQIGDRVVVRGEDGHHLSRVLRIRPGERVAISAAGVACEGEVAAVDSQSGEVVVHLDVRLASHEPQVSVYLAQALPKADKLEGVLQHGTELGFAGYLLFSGSRSVVHLDAKKLPARLERWRRIVRVAASQAQRDVIAPIEYAASATVLQSFIHGIAPNLILFLDEAEHTRTLHQVLPHALESLASPIIVCVGPEGGWGDEERELWTIQFGAVPVTLGPRVLRTETAGLVALSAVLYHFRALGG